MMKLWVSPTSPYVRKARMAVRELDMLDQVEEVFVKTSPLKNDAKLVAQNPLGKIPCLQHEQGFAIFDSRVICSYLDEQSAKASLHPSRNYKHETLIALVDGILDASVSAAYEKMLRPEELVYEDWISAQLSKVEEALKVAERDFMDILVHINMASLGMICAVEYLDMRHAKLKWRKIVPALAKWHDDIKDRPSAVDTRPPKS